MSQRFNVTIKATIKDASTGREIDYSNLSAEYFGLDYANLVKLEKTIIDGLTSLGQEKVEKKS